MFLVAVDVPVSVFVPLSSLQQISSQSIGGTLIHHQPAPVRTAVTKPWRRKIGRYIYDRSSAGARSLGHASLGIVDVYLGSETVLNDWVSGEGPPPGGARDGMRCDAMRCDAMGGDLATVGAAAAADQPTDRPTDRPTD